MGTAADAAKVLKLSINGRPQTGRASADTTGKAAKRCQWRIQQAAFKAAPRLADTNVSADNNPEYSTNPGNAMTDKVFLLSIDEVNRYFGSNEARKCAPTAYAIANGAWTSDTYTKGDAATCWWWLRSPGFYQDYAAGVGRGGSVDYFGINVNYDYDGIRPALWINLDS